MTQTTSRLFDEIGKLMTDAAGAAHGVRQEVESLVRTQAERLLNEMDVVPREEFEAVKAMARLAREENERLAAQLSAIEERLADLEGGTTASRKEPTPPPRPIRTDKKKSNF